MQIFITGGTGFIGSHLVERLLADGHCLTMLSRFARQSSRPELSYVQGDPRQPGRWQDVAASHQAVINLAGASVFRPWTEKNKRIIRESRIQTTVNIAAALSRENSTASVLINASAVGYYGDRGDQELDEQAPPGKDFLARVAADWEEAARQCAGVRVVCCRFGIVMGPDGGALEKMIPVFKLGLGSPLGPGDQWFSWVHVHDLVSILSFILNTPEISGPVNCTAPNPVTNRQLTKSLAGALHRPAFLPAVPSLLLKTVMGESSRLLLDSQKVVPGVLLDRGFTYTYPDIRSALEQIINQ
jgi:uncharacterized protein (TIGR01777 family)